MIHERKENRMNLNKTAMKNIIMIVLSSILFAIALLNLDKLMMFLTKAISVFMPLILGLCIAFIINPLMSILENFFLGVIRDKAGKKSTNISRGGRDNFFLSYSYWNCFSSIFYSSSPNT